MMLIPSTFEQRHAGKPCQYCGNAMDPGTGRPATRDHVFPKARGFGLDDFNGRNKAIVCQPCNNSKKHFDIYEWYRRLTAGGDPRGPFVARFIEKHLKTEDLVVAKKAPRHPSGIIYSTGEIKTTRAMVDAWERAWQKIEDQHAGE